MQASIIISILLNLVLGILVLSMVLPSLYKVYKTKKIERERQRVTLRHKEIRRIVVEYLEELKND